tara:strand:+ start:735 stop:1331 length:597 start_codon:yes stop_codon:yes gene_type:complete
MSDNTNEEKLRILQERLAQIQQKKEVKQKEKIENSKPVAPVFEEDLVNQEEIDPIAKTPREPRNKPNGLKYLIILFVVCLLGYSAFEFVDFKSILSSEESVEEIMEEDEEIKYYKSDFNGNYIILLKTFDKQELANAEVQNWVNEGYSSDVFYLPGVSNSKEKIFQTYIGPFNKLEEANQYLNSSEGIQNSGKIISLQ